MAIMHGGPMQTPGRIVGHIAPPPRATTRATADAPAYGVRAGDVVIPRPDGTSRVVRVLDATATRMLEAAGVLRGEFT